jgi:OPA family glycerol-3-phosphate transporter-like MFS transporter/OPA family sugar phosphate sensor protein UhpC-like MFS transporter
VFRPARSIQQISDPEQVRERYAYFRPRILFWSTVGYGMFYFVRKNLSVAMPVMHDQLGISKGDLGLFLTLHGLLYGVSKFGNGIIADRANARIFMPLGLALSALLNICFGFSTAVVALGVFWMINGWFQGMGFPPCARLLTHWFSPKELASKMAIWNASHTLGAGAIVVLCGYLVEHFHGWRVCFFVPAGLALAMAAALLWRLRDAPESVGLPELPGTHRTGLADPLGMHAPPSFRALLWEKVFSNRYIWIVSIANFFVYTIRYAVLDWGPTMLKEVKAVHLSSAGWIIAAFEISGLAGSLVAGWLTDRVFKGRAAPVSLMCMLLCGVMVLAFSKTPGHIVWLNTVLLMATGFFIYGPQGLVAVMAANLATKHAAATAVGLTSIFGYGSTILSGWGLGLLVQHYGWGGVFTSLVIVAALGALLFASALPAKVHGYAEE